MKIKTADLIGPALDWAVASIETLPIDHLYLFYGKPAIDREYLGRIYAFRCEFSSNWSQGGPIIERERIGVRHIGRSIEGELWDASISDEEIEGPTPLIAAMRCFVASKLGDKIEIPEELLK